ncbi:MAG TPA: DNA translocase FtsK [Pseudogracilibacillus sp.]|nr:DNA translocase FtsK [Pseudogracilibacillus sp.]
MAKKNKRRQAKQGKKQFKLELIGLLLVFLSIFGSGASMISEGFVPRLLENGFRFLFGIWYFVASILLLVTGLFLIIKRKKPDFFTKRKFGMLVIFLGVLLFTHIQTFEKLQISIEDSSIVKQSWHHFASYIKGVGVTSQLGGGMIGAFLFMLIHFLFSFAGAKIVAVFSILIGLLFATNFSLEQVLTKFGQYFKKMKEFFASKITHIRERRKEKNEVEELPMAAGAEEAPSFESEAKYEDPLDVHFADDNTEQMVIPLETEEEAEEEFEQDIIINGTNDESYELPSIELLSQPTAKAQRKDQAAIKLTVKTLEDTFKSFGVNAKVTKANVGPAVTRYEVAPEAGVKVSRILNLQDDLALALAAQDIRIEAPIPGKSAVGIEIPNKEIASVSLREVLDVNNDPHKKLLFALGRDISGDVITGELNKMPHILIAGATGSGKSVCINGIIVSILMRAKPSEVKMLMVDPKKVELNVYNGIPHLLTPVVTDPKKASIALRKIVVEMEERYELFSETGTRNVESYNNYIHKQNEETGEETPLLPYIVVLVDELADLMMVASSDVEDSITRLAQMARAAGIHLIIATQRPSVDVITGVIKANIPSRIAFSVSSQVDSRTILDMVGAEKLLGRGDMLYIPVGQSKPVRVQGAFLSDEEVERVVTHCKNEQQVDYDENMTPTEMPESFDDAVDELFEDAVALVSEAQSASVSMLQRRFRIGYNRAARLIDAMEDQGIIGPYEGNRPREVLIEKPVEEE